MGRERHSGRNDHSVRDTGREPRAGKWLHLLCGRLSRTPPFLATCRGPAARSWEFAHRADFPPRPLTLGTPFRYLCAAFAMTT
jgi:hypothetical protein